MTRATRRRRALLTAVALLVPLGAISVASAEDAPPPDQTGQRTKFALVEGRDVDDRLPVPEDRYAMAGGCYVLEQPGEGFVGRGAALVPRDQAEPFHFQATRLGEYLLATNEGPDTSVPGAWWDVRQYWTGSGLAAAPSPATEVVVEGTGPYDLSIGDEELGTYAITHVPDDDPADDDANGTQCADWPEIDVNASGRPQPTGDPAGPVQGFFEAHVHGMAYEFLGGELRCGQPWHPYGVEYALGACDGGGALNSVLEVGLAGQAPTDPVAAYDPVGWPTFGYWPQHDTLTHEQYYYRWLERAYLGGLRLTTNLLVDNTALCQLYPEHRNSCNEMDGVRLQAQRLHELQDYVDAQSGGPGEGWLRIVVTPQQARQTIAAGRLAIVMGIEVSVLFDCGEVLDQPQCTEADIDERLQEVFDMGVRQMELVNKFDNALSGVTGDSGQTGVVVNTGNKYVTQHYWDMQTCPAEPAHDHGLEGDEHDKTQTNLLDEAPDDPSGEVDQLAGRVIQAFAPALSLAVPAYGPGPHCNSRGLTPLGEHLITEMIAKGMVFDPDHMSASAQRAALDLIEDELVPAEEAAAAAEGRAPVLPSVISSHSWGNDVVYQRIHSLGGQVAPRTDDASAFADSWAQNRAWSQELAPDQITFGMGYGADTNGLGGQPGPRTDATQPLVYDEAGWQAPIGGVTLFQQTSGVRTYDVNTDGVAHYGLFADWFRELQLAGDQKHPELGGGQALIADMLAGSENYLQMWERAVYGGNDCVNDGSLPQVEDVFALAGADPERFLTAIGAPVSREDSAYVYCVEDAAGQPGVVEVPTGPDGTAGTPRPSDSGIVPTGGHSHPGGTTAVAASDLTGGSLAATGLHPGLAWLALAVLVGACYGLRLRAVTQP